MDGQNPNRSLCPIGVFQVQAGSDLTELSLSQSEKNNNYQDLPRTSK